MDKSNPNAIGFSRHSFNRDQIVKLAEIWLSNPGHIHACLAAAPLIFPGLSSWNDAEFIGSLLDRFSRHDHGVVDAHHLAELFWEDFKSGAVQVTPA